MKLNLKLRGKVANRIYLQFILCALLPIMALALVSYKQVRGELERQGQRRLHEDSINLGESIFERLVHLETDFNMFSLILGLDSGINTRGSKEIGVEHLKNRLKSLSFINTSGKSLPIFGDTPPSLEISNEEQQHLDSGKAMIQILSRDKNEGLIYMLKKVDTRELGRGILFGEIDPMYLWGLDDFNTLPAFTELAVLDNANNLIFSTHTSPPDFNSFVEFNKPRSSISSFEWEYQGQQYQADFRTVFMQFNWFYPRLIIVMSATQDSIFAPIEYFKIIFPLVLILALLIVLLLSAIQIRRVTQPIQELTISSKRIAEQEFDKDVKIKSGDEFEELGNAFNNMAKRLGSQFRALTTMSEISGAVLSSLNTKEIIDFLIFGIKDYFNYDLVKVSLFDPDGQEPALIYSGSDVTDEGTIQNMIRLPVDRLKAAIGKKQIVSYLIDKDHPDFFSPLLTKDIKAVALLPLFIKQKLSGIIILGTNDQQSFNQENLELARQLANQVAVALSNARLLEELDELNWGTLYALARTVDTKSQWTGNHSEKVAEMSVKIGRVMRLSEKELDNLRRGALLHDIGKIGIPVSILDKNSELSEQELEMMRRHPEIGARILEPITTYNSIIPTILQHHERFDGTGYPKGLSGNEITLGARILAVADVYEALSSDRPYRSALNHKQIIDILYRKSTGQFDPKVLDVLKTIIDSSDVDKVSKPKKRLIRGLRIEDF